MKKLLISLMTCLMLFSNATNIQANVVSSTFKTIVRFVTGKTTKKVEEKTAKTVSKEVAEQSAKQVSEEVARLTEKDITRKAILSIAGKRALAWMGNVTMEKLPRTLSGTTRESLSKLTIHIQSEYKLLNVPKGEELKTINKITTQIEKEMAEIEKVIKPHNQFISIDKLGRLSDEVKNSLNLTNDRDGVILGSNMRLAMGKDAELIGNAGGRYLYDAHHVVSAGSTKAMDKLNLYHINVNDPANGIFLKSDPLSPLGGAFHGHQHCEEYYKIVDDMFEKCSSRKDCLEALNKLKELMMEEKLSPGMGWLTETMDDIVGLAA